MRIHHDLLGILVDEEIDRTVAEAAAGPGFLRVGEQAYRLSREFPDSGLSGGELVNRLLTAAMKAGVVVETYQPDVAAA